MFGMAEDEQGVQRGWREVREGNGGGKKGPDSNIESEGRTKGITGVVWGKGGCERRESREDPK